MFGRANKKGQVTIFIIIAIILVVLVGVFFLFRNTTRQIEIPAFADRVENSFLDCLSTKLSTGANLLGSNAGYIYSPDFEPGSSYMPFSSHLNFVGNEIPYWYYLSGTGNAVEGVPTKAQMESQLNQFIEDQIINCKFEEYYDEGYEIVRNPLISNAKVEINDNDIQLNLDSDLFISKGEESYSISKHVVTVNSKLGSLYKDAVDLYEQEQESLFLENYTVDFMRLYAPVDGVELSCAPIIWNANNVFEDLKDGIEINTLALRGIGSDRDYFKVDNSLNNNFRFIYSKDWPSSFEVSPTEGSLMIARPVGNQQGLGILGFCYDSYHFVYNLAYPVLVQVYDEEEIFQFPFAVVIRGNLPRRSLEGIASEGNSINLCENNFSKTEISIKDYEYHSIGARVSYQCFGSTCDFGETDSANGSLTAYLPQCVNGNFIVNARGYKDQTIRYNSVKEGSIILFLDKEYKKEISLKLDGKNYNGEAMISFISDGGQTILYPETNSINLSEGDYQIQVYVYKNSSLKLGASTQQQCLEVPVTGIGSFFGATKQECFDINIPEQIVSNVLSAGGFANYSFSDSQLMDSNIIELSFESLPEVNSLEDLQNNYILFDDKEIEVNLK